MLGWIAEQRIQAAMRAGVFDDLPGANQPLPPDSLDPLVPPHLRAAMRVVRNSGGIPTEVVYRRELQAVESELASLPAQHPDIPRLRERRLEMLLALKRTL